ncbi:MAG: ATP-dependent Clp protease proteolytic subunit 1 [Pelotomaculum sp. PtaB.Bin104]|nr:MAG: ATP-dependent Clp protease proteolytic subunit 1 [Pelotomaculum sp. PtaB.Bin104]
MKYWEVKMKADKVGELLLYGPISDMQFWGDEVTPKQIDAELKALGELDTLNVRINSPGGSVFAGNAIFAILKRNETPNKCAYIDGLAASISSVIPFACNKVIAAGNAMVMIHKPYAAVMGTAELMRQRADLLDKMEETFIDVYEGKSGLDRDKIKEMLAAETWMTAQEALDFGFVDEIEQDMQIAASLDGDFLVLGEARVDLLKVSNEGLTKIKKVYREAIKTPEPVADKDQELSAQSKEFYRLRNKIYEKYEEEN